MAKKTIRVHTPFKLNSEDGTAQEFSVGEHTVDDKVADHWFVAAHAEITGKTKVPADTKEFQAQIDSLPLKRGPSLDEFGRTIRFLFDTPSITGQMIALDGGQHLIWNGTEINE